MVREYGVSERIRPKTAPLNKHQRDAAPVVYSAAPSAETVCGIITPTVMSIEQKSATQVQQEVKEQR